MQLEYQSHRKLIKHIDAQIDDLKDALVVQHSHEHTTFLRGKVDALMELKSKLKTP